MASQELCNKNFDAVYDIIAAFISLFDIITDFWILIQWYLEGRMAFFGISLSILILANFAYLLVFSIRYGDGYKYNPVFLCLCTCFFLPIAPLLSCTFYLLHEWDPRDSDLPSCFCCFEEGRYFCRNRPCLRIYKYREGNGGNESESRQWMEEKISRHIGYITYIKYMFNCLYIRCNK